MACFKKKNELLSSLKFERGSSLTSKQIEKTNRPNQAMPISKEGHMIRLCIGQELTTLSLPLTPKF